MVLSGVGKGAVGALTREGRVLAGHHRRCVEIPQLGMIRSLNVHVSAAIAMYQYTHQMLTR